MQLTVRDAAKFLNVSEKTVYRWAGAGEIPLYKVNGQYRFNKAELLEWANSRHLKISPEVLQDNEGGGPGGSVAEALQAGGVFYKVGGTDKPSVLRALVDTLRVGEKSERDALYDILIAREALGTTAVGEGIALPHVRNPIVMGVTAPVVNLCFLETPVQFGAKDGLPVHTLFWLISPNVPGHLQMLSKLAVLIRDPGFKVVLLRRGSPEEILAEARRVEAGSGKGP